MEKPIRMDYQAICFVGALLLSACTSIASTATTAYEDQGADIYLNESGHCEVKTIRKYSNCLDFDIPSNLNRWRVEPDVLEMCRGRRVWMLNYTDYGRAGKFQKMMEDTDSTLCYLMRDCIIYFTHEQLVESFIGTAWYNVPHTTYYDRSEVSWEEKALIDLGGGTRIECKPPEELFEKKRDRTFNERNGYYK